jgi:RNA polymerase sigma-70 factor (ECF subfamily)
MMPPGSALSAKQPTSVSQIAFVERLEPSAEHIEDLETARLVTSIQAGAGPDAFTALYRRYFDRVFSYLRLLVNDSHQAEDLTQDVFIKLMEKIPDYRRRSEPFRAWLFTVARNQAIDRLRRSNRLELDRNGDLEGRAERAEHDEPRLGGFDWISDGDLMLFVERLPLAQRQVLALRFMLDMTHAEIATVLGRSHEDVRTLQHRALRFLNGRLGAIRARPSTEKRRTRSQIYRRQAPVLRMRRFSLSP